MGFAVCEFLKGEIGGSKSDFKNVHALLIPPVGKRRMNLGVNDL